jgi:regulatory protein
MSFSRRGRPLAEEEKSTDAAKARARAMELLAGQELSSGQLYERLGRKFTQPTAAAVVAEMVERQYVDDERYARTRAHGLLAARKSRRAAAQDLRQKGLDAQQISAALEEAYASDEAGGDPELEAAAALVEGRYRSKLAAGRKDLVVAAPGRGGSGQAGLPGRSEPAINRASATTKPAPWQALSFSARLSAPGCRPVVWRDLRPTDRSSSPSPGR